MDGGGGDGGEEGGQEWAVARTADLETMGPIIYGCGIAVTHECLRGSAVGRVARIPFAAGIESPRCQDQWPHRRRGQCPDMNGCQAKRRLQAPLATIYPHVHVHIGCMCPGPSDGLAKSNILGSMKFYGARHLVGVANNHNSTSSA